MKDLNDYTLEELRAIEKRYKPTDLFTAVILVPTEVIHDSGWRCMKYIFTDGDEIVGATSGGSDVLHLNGIGGYGKDWRNVLNTDTAEHIAWSIDCLDKSGCTRLFATNRYLSAETFCVSDFSVYIERMKTYEDRRKQYEKWKAEQEESDGCAD